MIKPRLNKVWIEKSHTHNGYLVYGFVDMKFSYSIIIFHKGESKEECQIWCDMSGYHVEDSDMIYPRHC